LLDRITVNYYGAPTPLNQMASIQIPEARVLMVTPFDKSILQDVEKAIMASDIGISPTNDGNVIRLVIPQLTEERRKELAKDVKKEAENAKIAIRNIRRDAIDEYKKQQKNGDITEDDLRGLEKDVQTLTDNSIKEVDKIAADKEKELLEV
ncbi:ribosome recycling factor, partial [Enterococcus faecium]|uniref:ribosome recycling factor n=2 Tax=Enterococcus TaxID=1350 RepID=UPI001782FBF1